MSQNNNFYFDNRIQSLKEDQNTVKKLAISDSDKYGSFGIKAYDDATQAIKRLEAQKKAQEEEEKKQAQKAYLFRQAALNRANGR